MNVCMCTYVSKYVMELENNERPPGLYQALISQILFELYLTNSLLGWTWDCDPAKRGENLLLVKATIHSWESALLQAGDNIFCIPGIT